MTTTSRMLLLYCMVQKRSKISGIAIFRFGKKYMGECQKIADVIASVRYFLYSKSSARKRFTFKFHKHWSSVNYVLSVSLRNLSASLNVKAMSKTRLCFFLETKFYNFFKQGLHMLW